jgi:tRNA uridine 5-carbamoylmethylation protein Kti12
VDAVIAFERDGSIADSLSVPNTSEKVQLDRIMSTSETRRHRRQFIKISQMRPIPVSRIGDFFVDYLNKQS